jgi:hypothetical protein
MAITNGYCSLAEIKAAARIPVSDTQDDTLLELSVEAASRAIDGHTGRHFYQSGTATRYYVPTSTIVCGIDDVAGIATVAISSAADGVYDITLGAADLQYEPLNRRVAGLAFPSTRLRMIGDYSFPTTWDGEATVRVQANFGFGTAVPTEIKQAAIVLASRFYKRFDSPLGVAGFGDMGAMRVSRVDPDVQAILSPFVHAAAVGVA